jgi:hypothetical protein
MRYQQFAAKLKEQGLQSCSINTVAAAFGIPWEFARQVLDYARTGQRPKWRPSASKRKRGDAEKSEPRIPLYRKHANWVARLREEEDMTFPQITVYIEEQCGDKMSPAIATRAYDLARPGAAQQALAVGGCVSRGTSNMIGPDKYRKIRKMLAHIPRPKDKVIAAAVGCGTSTVGRERRRVDAGMASGGGLKQRDVPSPAP